MIPNISQGHFSAPILNNPNFPMVAASPPLLYSATMIPMAPQMAAPYPSMLVSPPTINCPNPLENEVYNQSVNCFSYPTLNNFKSLFRAIDLYAKTLSYSLSARNLVTVSLNHVFSARQIPKEIISESLQGLPDEFIAFLLQTIAILPDPIKFMFAHIDLSNKINNTIQNIQSLSNQIILNANSALDESSVPQQDMVQNTIQHIHNNASQAINSIPNITANSAIQSTPAHVPNIAISTQNMALTKSKPQTESEGAQLTNKKKKRKSIDEQDKDFVPGNALQEFATIKKSKKKSKSKSKKKAKANPPSKPSVAQTPQTSQNLQASNQPSAPNLPSDPNPPALNQNSTSNQALDSNQVNSNSTSDPNTTPASNPTTVPKSIFKKIIEKAWYLNSELPISALLTMPALSEAYNNLSSLQKASLDKVYKQFQMEIVKVFKTEEVISFISDIYTNTGNSYIDIQFLLAKRNTRHQAILKSMLAPFVNLFAKLQHAELAYVPSNIFSAIWFNAIISSSLVFTKYDSYFVTDFRSIMRSKYDIGNAADYLLVGLWYSTQYFRKNHFIVGFGVHIDDENQIRSYQEEAQKQEKNQKIDHEDKAKAPLKQMNKRMDKELQIPPRLKYKNNLIFILSRKVEEMFLPF